MQLTFVFCRGMSWRQNWQQGAMPEVVNGTGSTVAESRLATMPRTEEIEAKKSAVKPDDDPL